MVLNDVAQTCCGWESLNCVPIASYCVHTMAILRQLCTHDDRFTFLQRQKYVILRCIGQHYVLTRSFGAEHVRCTFISCSHSVHGTSSKLSINTAKPQIQFRRRNMRHLIIVYIVCLPETYSLETSKTTNGLIQKIKIDKSTSQKGLSMMMAAFSKL